MSSEIRKPLRGPRGRIRSTWKIIKSPYESYRKWTSIYGETFLIPALNGDVIATSNTEIIRRVYAARYDEVAPFAVSTIEPLVGAKSVILSEGKQHRLQRKQMMPSFHGDVIAEQKEVIRQVALRHSSNWQEDQVIRVMDDTLDISLEVIIQVVFGIKDPEIVELNKRHITDFVKTFRPSLAFSKLLQRPLFGLSPWNRFVKAKMSCMELLQKEIDERRKSGERGDDLLSRLLDAEQEDGSPIPDQQIRGQLATMLFAGHETTQIAIAWAISWLARHSEIQNELFEQLQEKGFQEVVGTSKLLQGICNESLRLNPIVPDSVRVLNKEIECEGHYLPQGSNVGLLASIAHYNPQVFPEPERFKPSRWYDKTYKPSEFFPFGGGIRKCIGATLATLEMKAVVATWIENYLFQLPTGSPESEPVHRRNLVMAPVSGVRVLPIRRK
jgi:cytochrome P450